MRHTAAIFAALLLVACAATGPVYAPAERAGAAGYDETQIEVNRFRVSYQGRSADPVDLVQDLALYRAAEVTTAFGYDWFSVVSSAVEESAVAGGGSDVSIGVGSSSGSRSGTSVGVGFGLSLPLGGGAPAGPTKTTLEIITGYGEKPNATAYAATEVLANVGAARLGGRAG